MWLWSLAEDRLCSRLGPTLGVWRQPFCEEASGKANRQGHCMGELLPQGVERIMQIKYSS